MYESNVFLIQFAGGSFLSYNFLLPHLNKFNLYALELPGRGKRIREKILHDMEEAKNDVLKQMIKNIIPGKSIIFGHSLGAMLGFLVTSELEKINLNPKAIILTGQAGIGINSTKKIHDFSKSDFKEELKTMGGMPSEFFNNEQLFDFYEPILRADIKLSYDISLLNNIHIKTPIHAIMGSAEPDSINIMNWANYTSGNFRHELMSGDHFFIFNNPDKITRIIEMYARDLY